MNLLIKKYISPNNFQKTLHSTSLVIMAMTIILSLRSAELCDVKISSNSCYCHGLATRGSVYCLHSFVGQGHLSKDL